ncbi:MAG: hypothetical protein PHY59_05435 [Methanobacterium sp.]|nr:hypothetical protein [Methanobacterium sp.]
MVIAKSEWFKNKNGSFFDLKMPWQGYVYLLCMATVMLFGGIFLPDNPITNITIGGLFIFLLFDMMYAKLKSMDERAKSHYSIAMRNSSWMIITGIMSYIILTSFNTMNLPLLFIITGGIGGIISIATHYKLEKNN